MSTQLNAPTNIAIQSPNVLFNAVDGANKYVFVSDSTEIGTYQATLPNVSYYTFFDSTPQTRYTPQLTASDLPTLTDNNHTFSGWYYDDAFTSVAQVGDTITEKVVLFAKWDMKHSYTETMGANTIDTRANKNIINVTYNGAVITTLDVPQRTLKTQNKLVQYPIIFGNFTLNKSGRVFTQDVIITRTDILDAPMLEYYDNILYLIDKNNKTADIYNIYVDNTLSKVIYKVDVTLSNVTPLTNKNYIVANGTQTLQFEADDGYSFSDCTVSGASYTWDSTTGTLVLSNPSSVVSVSISAT